MLECPQRQTEGGAAVIMSAMRRMWRPSARLALGTCAAFVAMSCCMAAPASAGWPERPVKLIVAVAAGGPTDDLARTLANGLSEALGGSFVVENRGGGGGRIGIGAVARADPDGYTLLVAASSLTISAAMSASTPYDAEKDFAPIALIATTPSAFSVTPALGVNDLNALIELSKRGDGLNYATPGTGTVGHLAAELFKIRSGIVMSHVAHTGAGPSLQSLLSGAVQVLATPVPSVQTQVEAGAVKALAVTSEKRWLKLPDVPTMVELGYADFVADTFFGLLAPAATPREVLTRLTAATLELLRKPDITVRLEKLGYDIAARGPADLSLRIRHELAQWRDVARQAGLVMK